ncbi:MAG: c-type cytochrome biogenesis protein CcmI [Gammaproteobacteria bacterium]|nr:c-type cytochrome biogenesis protein CcmI [Gammaproteobacteria bacterium]MBQ0838987.1 c-type cytochrome biogenesis protein CcmI [Gammaproteobacteria bacterium]
MSFWLVVSALLVMALSFVLYSFIPSVKRRRGNRAVIDSALTSAGDQQQELNVGLFREQQTSLEAQRDAGELSESEYVELLADAQRRLLEDVKLKDNNGVSSLQVAVDHSGNWLLIGAALVVLAFSILLYGQLGAATDMDIARLLQQSQSQQATGQDAKSAIAEKLHSALIKGTHKSPDNLYYWVLLARLEQERNNTEAAVTAYRGALAVAPDDANVHAELAQVLFSLAGNTPTEEMQAHARKALAADPGNASALGLLGISAFAQQDYRGASTYWQAALQNTAPMSSSAKALRSGISRAKALLGEAVSDWSISLRVSLPAPLVAPPDATVFVYLREWQGMPMPLVAQRVRVADLPLTIEFDDTMALSPERLPSGIRQIEVVARIAMSDQRQASSGDLEGRLGPLSAEQMEQSLNLEINSRLP